MTENLPRLRTWLHVGLGIAALWTTGCLSGEGFSEVFPEDGCGQLPKPRDQTVEIETSLGQITMFQVHGSLVRSLDDACFSEAQIELRQDEDCALTMSFSGDPGNRTRLLVDEVDLVASSSVCVLFPKELRGRYAASELALDSGQVWLEGTPNSDTVNRGCHREPLTVHLGGEMRGTTTGQGAATSFEFSEADYEIDVPLDAISRAGSCGE